MLIGKGINHYPYADETKNKKNTLSDTTECFIFKNKESRKENALIPFQSKKVTVYIFESFITGASAVMPADVCRLTDIRRKQRIKKMVLIIWNRKIMQSKSQTLNRITNRINNSPNMRTQRIGKTLLHSNRPK